MRTLFVALVGMSCGISLVSGQGFNKRYDANGMGYEQGAYGIEPMPSGHAIFDFSYEPDTIAPDTVIGTYRIVITGINETGEVLWEKKHTVHQKSMYLGWADCCDTVSGGFVSAGTIGGSDMIGSVRLMRYDANGDTLWVREFGGPGETWVGSQVKHTSDDGFLICGYTDAFSLSDAFALKVDADGNEQWREHYNLGGNVPVDFCVIQESSTGYYLAGNKHLNAEDRDFYVVKVDGSGDELWSSSFGGPFPEPASSLLLHSSGSLFLLGAWDEGTNGQQRPYLALLDTLDGGIVWDRTYGPAIYSTTFFAAKECPNTDIIACGVNYQGAVERGMLLRATSNGDSLWMRNYNFHDDVIETGEGRFWDVLPTADGGFIATGFMNGPYPMGYSQDAWVVKVDSMGCIVPGCDGTGVTEVITNLQGTLTVYPNPAHGQVQVALDLPANFKLGALDLSIVGMDGRVVRRIPWSGNGSSTMRVDVSDLSAGMYTLHVTDGTKWITGTKLVIE